MFCLPSHIKKTNSAIQVIYQLYLNVTEQFGPHKIYILGL